MFKLLILQRLHNLSDERLQYQVTDRLSFMRFLGLKLSGDVPDARTVWAFREALKAHELAEALFDRLSQALADLGVELKSGQIIDATFVPVPIQRNGREDNAIIKQDAVPIDWGKSPAKLAQKDIDARWTKKGGQNHFGFKNQAMSSAMYERMRANPKFQELVARRGRFAWTLAAIVLDHVLRFRDGGCLQPGLTRAAGQRRFDADGGGCRRTLSCSFSSGSLTRFTSGAPIANSIRLTQEIVKEAWKENK
jgi:hypothetical protein